MKNTFAAAVILISCTFASAAPVANAPLATPVLVDSTGKLIGRYVDGSVLVNFNGETVALDVAPRTTLRCTANYTYFCTEPPAPSWTAGLYWAESGVTFDATLIQGFLSGSVDPTTIRMFMFGKPSKTATAGAVFSIKGKYYAVITKGVPIPTSANPFLFNCLKSGACAGFIKGSTYKTTGTPPPGATELYNDFGNETTVIAINDLGVEPFFVK